MPKISAVATQKLDIAVGETLVELGIEPGRWNGDIVDAADHWRDSGERVLTQLRLQRPMFGRAAVNDPKNRSCTVASSISGFKSG